MRNAIALLVLGVLASCGQTGKLYLPDTASDVVTRPAESPPAPDTTEAPNSPQTPDTQPAAPAPAPEVTAPEAPGPDAKKEKSASPPPSN